MQGRHNNFGRDQFIGFSQGYRGERGGRGGRGGRGNGRGGRGGYMPEFHPSYDLFSPSPMFRVVETLYPMRPSMSYVDRRQQMYKNRYANISRTPQDVYLDEALSISPHMKLSQKDLVQKYIRRAVMKNCWFEGHLPRPQILLVSAKELGQMIDYQVNLVFQQRKIKGTFSVQRLLYIDKDFQGQMQDQNNRIQEIFRAKLKKDKGYQESQLMNCVKSLMDHYYSQQSDPKSLYHEKTNFNIYSQLYSILIQYNIDQNQYYIKIGFDQEFRNKCSKYVTNKKFNIDHDPYKKNRQFRFSFETQLTDVSIGLLKISDQVAQNTGFRNTNRRFMNQLTKNIDFFSSYETCSVKQSIGLHTQELKEIHILNENDCFKIFIRLTDKFSLMIKFSHDSVKHIYTKHLKQNKNKQKQQTFYIELKSIPEFYAQISGPDMHYNPQHTNYWHRIPNFVTLYNKYFQEDYLKAVYNTYCSLKLVGRCRDELSLDISQKFVGINRYKQKDAKQYTDRWGRIKQILLKKLPKQADLSKKIKSLQISLDYLLAVQNKQDLKVQNFIFDKILQNYLNYQTNQSEQNMLRGIDCVYNYLHEKENYRNKYLQDPKQFIFDEQGQNKNFQNPNIIQIYNIRISPSGMRFDKYTNEHQSRIFRKFDHRLFIKACFCEENGDPLSIETYQSNSNILIQNVFRELINGFKIEGYKFVPFGWSSSQIKRSQMWFILEDDNIYPDLKTEVMKFLGDFDEITSPAKKAARIGQSFCSSTKFSSPQLIQEILVDDIVVIRELIEQKTDQQQNLIKKIIKKQYKYTDGIGIIDSKLLAAIVSQLKDKKTQNICAIQCRYKGYKGVLSLGNMMRDTKNNQQPISSETQAEQCQNLQNQEEKSKNMFNKQKIFFTKSMKKFNCQNPESKNHFDILNWNKYCPGYLNSQIIVLLKSLKVPQEKIMQRLKSHLEEIYQFTLTDKSILLNYFKTHLDYSPINDDPLFQLLNYMAANQKQIIQTQTFFNEVCLKVKRQLSNKCRFKMRFKIQKSARLLGILDTYCILQENQVFCAIKKSTDKEYTRTVLDTKAFMTKNPCLHPADIRRVKCISEKQIKQRLQFQDLPQDAFDFYTNCIVFPQKGQYPLSCAISGGDLDGDYYLICWDEDLYPPQELPVNILDDYNVQQDKLLLDNPKIVAQSDIWDFFIKHLCQQKLGLISKTHLLYADNHPQGARCKECIQLAHVHSIAIDFSKKGIPYSIPANINIKKYQSLQSKISNQREQTFLGRLLTLVINAYHQHLDVFNRCHYEHIGNQWYFKIKKFRYSKAEVTIAMQTVLTFKYDIERILEQKHKKWSSQFTIYSGRDDEFVIDSLQLKSIYQNEFFSNLPQSDRLLYKQLNFKSLKQAYSQEIIKFSQQSFRKAYLWYILSNSHIIYEALQYIQPQYVSFMEQFNVIISSINSAKMEQNQRSCKNKGLQVFHNTLGMAWHVIPKIMVLLIDRIFSQNYQGTHVQKVDIQEKCESNAQQVGKQDKCESPSKKVQIQLGSLNTNQQTNNLQKQEQPISIIQEKQSWSKYYVEISMFPKKTSFKEWMITNFNFNETIHYRNLTYVQSYDPTKRFIRIDLRNDVYQKINGQIYDNKKVNCFKQMQA